MDRWMSIKNCDSVSYVDYLVLQVMVKYLGFTVNTNDLCSVNINKYRVKRLLLSGFFDVIIRYVKGALANAIDSWYHRHRFNTLSKMSDFLRLSTSIEIIVQKDRTYKKLDDL